ncbi:MAG TPA: hypothetical protein DCS82_03030 [Rhodospirillaceae bacterium]|nr:hypothetical protein [Rhodospirillaceae bacterium]HAA92628.1 hypothetical protein [Rhodospirillaceae bacterium]HAT34665.1 hypothetical protein [Rhodospirillaceae bacterium]|tara:strand:- start:322 stop:621 length:300 start_codon:yes stop_codon:yes gene_type:complete
MKLQALKFLVVFMGLMIFVGLGFLAYGIAAKFTGGSTGLATTANPVSFSLPKGATIRETTLDGERVLLRLVFPDGSRRLMIFNIVTGQQISSIELKNAP